MAAHVLTTPSNMALLQQLLRLKQIRMWRAHRIAGTMMSRLLDQVVHELMVVRQIAMHFAIGNHQLGAIWGHTISFGYFLSIMTGILHKTESYAST